MRKMSLVASLVFCFAFVGTALAGNVTLNPTHRGAPSINDTTVNVPFPTAGDAFCGSNFCGNIPAGGQTDFMFTAGDFVISSIFTLPTNSVTDLTANWTFQDFLGVSTENFNVLLNGVLVATVALPPCGECGTDFTVTGTVNFADVAPVGGGYQIELVETNSIPPGDGSIAWLDGGITGLSFAGGGGVPEPGSLLLLGTGMLGLAGTIRRKLF